MVCKFYLDRQSCVTEKQERYEDVLESWILKMDEGRIIFVTNSMVLHWSTGFRIILVTE